MRWNNKAIQCFNDFIFATDHASKHIMLAKPLTGQIIHAPGLKDLLNLDIIPMIPKKTFKAIFSKMILRFQFWRCFFSKINFVTFSGKSPFSNQKKCTTSRLSQKFT